MFWQGENDYLEIALDTTRYLGTRETSERFLALLFGAPEYLLPERWDTDERKRPRNVFDRRTADNLLADWTSGEKIHHVFFYRKRPIEIQISISIERFARAKFNTFRMFVREDILKDRNQPQQLLRPARWKAQPTAESRG